MYKFSMVKNDTFYSLFFELYDYVYVFDKNEFKYFD